ncbi:heme oxygenase [Xylographa opegraphella]|nr:heme oxygenase [Xylographa opegraphella]
MAERTEARSQTSGNSNAEHTLPAQINSATRLYPHHLCEAHLLMFELCRSLHTQLNRLILARLPLALPPNSQSPETYTTGIQHIAPIYRSFESRWADIVDLQPLEASQAIDHRVFSALKHLYMPDMLRARNLRSDLSILLHKKLDEVDDVLENMEELQLHRFLQHFEQTCGAKPHVLIAYAWVMYMALFNGGRWIRAQLLVAKTSYWYPLSLEGASESPNSNPSLGLAFWHFPGEEDGEDIKNEFKARLNDIEALLNVEQRQDIVDEASSIFRYLALLVGELDEIVTTKPIRASTSSLSTAWSQLLVKHFLPLGMAELLYAFLHWIRARRWYLSFTTTRQRGRSNSDTRKRR